MNENTCNECKHYNTDMTCERTKKTLKDLVTGEFIQDIRTCRTERYSKFNLDKLLDENNKEVEPCGQFGIYWERK